MSKSEVPYLYGAEETIPIEQLHPFANHPFHVRHDLEMKELMDSIEESGIIHSRPAGLLCQRSADESHLYLRRAGCAGFGEHLHRQTYRNVGKQARFDQ